MIGQQLRRAVAVGFVAALGAAGVAIAQTAGPPAGDFGGGAIRLPVDENTVAKDMLLSIRAAGSGRIGVDGQIYTACGHATIKGRTRLASDGSFTLRGDAGRKPLRGVTQRSEFTVRGRLTSEGGTGTARAIVRVRTRRGASHTCKSRTVSWTVRRPGAIAAPAPAPADATLFGLTSQKGANARRAIVLHTTKGGRAIDRLVLAFGMACERRRVVVGDEINYSPEFDVAADGSFRAVERFKRTYSDLMQRSTIVVRGQFDQAGGVAGKLSVKQRYTNRRNGRRVDLCSTGTRSWSARP